MDDVAQDARGRSAGAVAGGINAETARGMRVCAERQRQLMNADGTAFSEKLDVCSTQHQDKPVPSEYCLSLAS